MHIGKIEMLVPNICQYSCKADGRQRPGAGMPRQVVGLLTKYATEVQAYGRASEMEPGRLYSLLQMGGIQLSLGALPAAAATFSAALALAPRHPAAWLGAAEAALASADAHASIGASGAFPDLAHTSQNHAGTAHDVLLLLGTLPCPS